MSDIMSAPRITSAKQKAEVERREPRGNRSPRSSRFKQNSLYGRSIPAHAYNARRNENSFGVRISLIRLLLGQTQEAFADMMLTNRQAVASIERAVSIEQLSEGMIFRTYYLTKEISENKYVTNDIRERANQIVNEIRTYILNKNE